MSTCSADREARPSLPPHPSEKSSDARNSETVHLVFGCCRLRKARTQADEGGGQYPGDPGFSVSSFVFCYARPKGVETAGAGVGAVQRGARGAQPAHHQRQGPAGEDENFDAPPHQRSVFSATARRACMVA